MPQLLIRNFEDETVEQLKARAKANHRSLQAEVQLILEHAAEIQPGNFWSRVIQYRSPELPVSRRLLPMLYHMSPDWLPAA